MSNIEDFAREELRRLRGDELDEMQDMMENHILHMVREEVGEGRYQNKRCPRVFKDSDGRAYDIEGKVFVEPSGAAFTSRDSRVYVDFPYWPTTEKVPVSVN